MGSQGENITSLDAKVSSPAILASNTELPSGLPGDSINQTTTGIPGGAPVTPASTSIIVSTSGTQLQSDVPPVSSSTLPSSSGNSTVNTTSKGGASTGAVVGGTLGGLI